METKNKTKIDVPTTMGERIKLARESVIIDGKSMSQGVLAKKVGVQRPAVSQWEDGSVKSIRGEYLEKLCKAVKRSPGYILHGKEETKVDMAKLSDEAHELAHAWEGMPDSEWKERVYYFVTTYRFLGRVSQGEQQLNPGSKAKKPKKSK